MPRLRELRERHPAAATVGVALAPVVVCALFVPVRGVFTTTAAALVLVVVVGALALVLGRPAGYLSSFLAAASFDFFLTQPYEHWAISHRPDLETTVSLVVVGIATTELAAWSRRWRRHAATEADDLRILTDLAAAVAAGGDDLVEATRRQLVDLLGLRECLFEPGRHDPPHARLRADGTVVHVGMVWPAHEIGLPGPWSEIVCEWRGRPVGRFLLSPRPGAPVGELERRVAVGLVNVVAAGLGQSDAAAR